MRYGLIIINIHCLYIRMHTSSHREAGSQYDACIDHFVLKRQCIQKCPNRKVMCCMDIKTHHNIVNQADNKPLLRISIAIAYSHTVMTG